MLYYIQYMTILMSLLAKVLMKSQRPPTFVLQKSPQNSVVYIVHRKKSPQPHILYIYHTNGFIPTSRIRNGKSRFFPFYVQYSISDMSRPPTPLQVLHYNFTKYSIYISGTYVPIYMTHMQYGCECLRFHVAWLQSLSWRVIGLSTCN